jgi:hypothetical protein
MNRIDGQCARARMMYEGLDLGEIIDQGLGWIKEERLWIILSMPQSVW